MMKDKGSWIILSILLLFVAELLSPVSLIDKLTSNIWLMVAIISWLVYGILPGIKDLMEDDKNDRS